MTTPTNLADGWELVQATVRALKEKHGVEVAKGAIAAVAGKGKKLADVVGKTQYYQPLIDECRRIERVSNALKVDNRPKQFPKADIPPDAIVLTTYLAAPVWHALNKMRGDQALQVFVREILNRHVAATDRAAAGEIDR